MQMTLTEVAASPNKFSLWSKAIIYFSDPYSAPKPKQKIKLIVVDSIARWCKSA